MRSLSSHFRDALVSVIVCTLGVGILVGNAYIVCNVGYPELIQVVATVIMIASLIFAIPPSIPLLILGLLGVDLPFEGRERFIQLNPWLWIYCVIFYAFAVYLYLRIRRRVKRHALLSSG